MTVAAQTTFNTYTGNGVTTVFPYQFKILANTDLQVYVDGALKALGVDYTVSGVGADVGGSVTFISGAPAASKSVSIIRAMTVARSTDYQQQGDFNSTTVNPDFDRAILLLQDVHTQLGRTIRTPVDEVGTIPTLPSIAARAGRFMGFDANGQPVPLSGSGADSALRTDLADGVTAGLGSKLVAITRTAAEVSTGATIADASKSNTAIDVQRYGILPNNIAFAATNTARLIALLDPTKTGPHGDIEFYPIIGGDTYHFNDVVQIRDKCRLKLNGCRLLFTKTAAASDQKMGLLTMMRDVTIEGPGTIEANITGTVGTNACALFRIGSRSSYPFGSYTSGVFDKTDLADNGLDPQGRCTLRNLKFKSNNAYANCASIGFALGGIRDVLIEQCQFEGSGAGGPGTGFYYEMGDASNNGFPSTPAKWATSHCINLQLRNIRGKNLNTVGVSPDDAVVSITEPNDFIIDGIYGESANCLVSSRYGEGHYHNAWTPDQTAGPRVGVIRGARCGNTITASAILVNGAGAAVGQFSDAAMIAAGVPVLTLQEKIDLLRYEISGFDIRANTSTGNGIVANAPVTIRDGVIRGGFNGIFLQAECSEFAIDNVRVLDTSGIGIRANSDSTLLAGKKKRGRIVNSKIAGSTASAGITLDYVDGVLIENNQIGYIQAKGDAADEATQTVGVSVGSDGRNVICRNNNVKTSGGSVAYALASVSSGEESGGNGVVNPIGTVTYSGKWRGVLQAVNLTIAAATPGDHNIVYSQRTFEYVRSVEGDRVDYAFRLEMSTWTYTTAAGQLTISGLPYTVNAGAWARHPVACTFTGFTKANYTQVMFETTAGATTGFLVGCGSGQAAAALAVTDFPTAGSPALRASGHYFTS